ncbi:hypothetical protein PsorP6_004602 [Peronosclerospora sorghi]|uniref:Uncharacterized protein n=1 Tax=Peronosclerospora sorghi TaxID=230839 RepID=A0ACC0VP85_9STRA|nr:hypothetical protein PsorP6_004602 [Peronosclerospora sorghi]
MAVLNISDPKDPQFIGPQQVADGEELVLGILMSCSAVLLSNFICVFFPRQSTQLRTTASRSAGPFTDWGCLCCNLVASVLAGCTYQLSRISAIGLTNNLLALKFVSSFCGSLSMFSGAVSIISLPIDHKLLLTSEAAVAYWKSAISFMELIVAAACGADLYTVSLQIRCYVGVYSA